MTLPHEQQAAFDDDAGVDGGESAFVPGADGVPPAQSRPVNSDELHQVRADLYYIASDLRSLARHAPPHKAPEILALSDLVASLAGKWS